MKVAITVPHLRQVEALFAKSLAELMYASRDLELRLIMGSSSSLDWSRAVLTREALDWGADWLLKLDSDMIFPDWTLRQLLKAKQQIVGANYARRGGSFGPTAQRDGEPVLTTHDKRGLEQVDRLGFGAVLIAAEVFKAVERPWFRTTVDAECQLEGEDAYFFRKARDTGFSVWCDHTLSAAVGHIHERILTNDDAVKAACIARLRGGDIATDTPRSAAGHQQ